MDNRGETLAETLVALMIIIIVITGFAGVIANVTNANKAIRSFRATYDYDFDTPDTKGTWTFKIYKKGTTSDEEKYSFDSSKITGYIDNNGLYYYEHK